MNNMDLSNSDLSGIPADLLAAHEFQKGSEIHSQPIQVPAQPVQAEIKIKDEDMSELMEDVKDESTYKQEQESDSATVKIEAEANGGEDKTPEQMDTLDKALAADKVVKEEGYESSDLELSSDDDDDDESDSSSSSDDDEEDDEEVEEEGKGKKGNNNKKMAADYDDEDDIAPDGIVKTAHEIVDIVIEKPEFEFTPDTEIILAGEIYQIIDNVVVVHCRPGSEHMTLDQGSLLVYKDRVILGEVFETFGPVPRPYYSVRFNNPSEINKDLCKVGEPVYFVPSYEKTRIVKTEELKKIKGYDASNMYDEEIGEEEMEFSDDEKELQFKRKKNKEKKARRNGDNSNNNNSNNPNSNPNHHHHNQSRFAPQKRNRALPDDFDSALAAYESSQGPLPPRQQQSYADLNDGYAFQQGFPLPSANRSALPPPPVNPYRTPAELVTELFGSSSQNPVNQYNRPQPSLPQQQQPQYQPQPQPQQQYQQYQQQPPQLSQNQNQSQNQDQNQQSKKSFRSIFAEPPPPSS